MKIKKTKPRVRVTTTALKKAHGAIFVRLADGMGLGLLPRKCFNVMLHYAQDKGTDQRAYHMDVDDIGNIVGFNSKNMDYLKDTLRGLQGRQVEWDYINEAEQKIWGVASLLSVVQIVDREVIFSFADEVKQLLLSPRLFCHLDLETQNQFKSEFSLILYEICCRYKTNPGGLTLKLDWMLWRVLLGCEGNATYNEFFRFKDKVLKPAVAEINQKADFTVTPIYVKEGRKVSLIQFRIEQKPQQQRALDLSDSRIELERDLADLGLSPSQVDQILNNYDERIVVRTAHYVAGIVAKPPAGPIANVPAYFMTILANGGAPETVTPKQKALQIEKAAKEKEEENAEKERIMAIEIAKERYEKMTTENQSAVIEEYLAAMEETNKPAVAAFKAKGLASPIVRGPFFAWFAKRGAA